MTDTMNINSSSIDETDLDCTDYDELLIEICNQIETAKSEEQDIFDSYFDQSLMELCDEIEKT